MTTITPPIAPCVMKLFDPVMTQPSPDRVAVVRIPAASLPALASVSPQAPSTSPRARRGRNRCFCAWLPKSAMCAEHRPLCAATDSAIAGQTRASSSMQMQ